MTAQTHKNSSRVNAVLLEYGLQPFQSVLILDNQSNQEDINVAHGSITISSAPPKGKDAFDYIWLGERTPDQLATLAPKIKKSLHIHSIILTLLQDNNTSSDEITTCQELLKPHLLSLLPCTQIDHVEKKLVRIKPYQNYGSLTHHQTHQLTGSTKPRKDARPPSWHNTLRLARSINDYLSMDEAQQEAVYKYALQVKSGGNIVEVGIAYGKTGSVIANTTHYTNANYIGIDNFSRCGTPQEFKDRFDQRCLPFELWVSDSNTLDFARKIDMLIIDAGHSEIRARNDILKYVPLLKPGGIVMFHDYDPQFDIKSPHWAINFFADKLTGHWQMLDHIGGLMIRKKPTSTT